LASGVTEFGEVYAEAMSRAGNWLVDTQDADGCWRKYPTPFASPGEKAYETHVAWGLFEAARVGPESRFVGAAIANIRWALRYQRDNGWFDNCCLTDPLHPLTHTLGYVLRGILEAYRYTEEPIYLRAAQRTADAVVKTVRDDGYLPGRLTADWTPAVSWVCLTGSAQIAHCLLMLHAWTGEFRYLRAALSLNRFVRRTILLTGPQELRGAVKGSYPIDGAYGAFEFLDWACKFMIDANVLEHEVTQQSSATPHLSGLRNEVAPNQ